MQIQLISTTQDGDALVFTFTESGHTFTVRQPDTSPDFGYRGFKSRFLVGGSPDRVDRSLAEGDHLLTFFGTPRHLVVTARVLEELGRRRGIRLMFALEERHGQTILFLFAHELMFDIDELKADVQATVDVVNAQLQDHVPVAPEPAEEVDRLDRIGEEDGPGIYYEEDDDISGVDFVPMQEVDGP